MKTAITITFEREAGTWQFSVTRRSGAETSTAEASAAVPAAQTAPGSPS